MKNKIVIETKKLSCWCGHFHHGDVCDDCTCTIFMEKTTERETIEALIQNLKAVTVGLHEAKNHEGPVDKCGWDNCRWSFEAIAQAEGK